MLKRTCRYIKRVRGFSMVEMAVTMASVAAVAVVVAGGVAMVNKVRLGEIISEVNLFSNAIGSFEEKYGGLPGDLADVSDISGATAGNGNGAIDTAAEALYLWEHLSLTGFIQGNYDGSSTNVPGVGVPAGSIESSGYNILTAAESGLEAQSIVIEIAGFGTADNDLAILRPEDAYSIDKRADDGDPDTGIVRAVEGNGLVNQCISGGVYNLATESVSCRVRFVIREGQASGNAAAITEGGTDPCDKMGATRESDATSDICPVGYVGRFMETCRINSSNQGNWEVTARNCEPITCSGGSKYGDKRSLACINGMTGTGITQTCGVGGVWTVDSSDCTLPNGVTACSPDGIFRDPQACDWGKEGGVKQTCTSATWSTDGGGDSCAATQCSGAQNIGATKTISCAVANNYSGNTAQVCGIDGVWRSTSIGSDCAPIYAFTCTEGVTPNRTIGCAPGETGQHTQECIGSNKWATYTNTCVPVTCDGENIGTARVKEGAVCANDKNGVVMEVCHTDGTWVEVTSNCAKTMCKGNADTLGYAVWPNTNASSVGTGACAAGYKISGSAPTRSCDAAGAWSASITNPCVIDQCAAAGAWSATNSSTSNVLGSCVWPQMEGRPYKDCNASAVWDNERYLCQSSDITTASDITLWLDASDASTIYEDTGCTDEAEIGDSVACWKDKSGNALNVTETTNRPLYIDNGRNMRSILRFDGTNDRMIRTSVSGSSLGTAEEVTLFAAYEYTNKSGADYNSDVVYWASTNGRFNFIGIYGDALFYWDYGTTGGVSTTRTTVASSNFMDSFNIVSMDRRIDNTSSIWVNGVHFDTEYSKTDAFLVGESATLQIMQGAAGYTKGDMGELIVYKRQMSDVERVSVEGYLMDKWNVSALPVSNDVSLWLDAADADTMYLEAACTNKVSATGNTVGCWQDKSGNGLNVTQGTAANEPAYTTNVENGRSILRFDGSNDELATANVAASSLGGPNSVTVFTAYQYDSPIHNSSLLYFIEGSTNRLNIHGLWTGNLFAWDYGAVWTSAATRTSFNPTYFMDMFQVIALDRQKDGMSGIWINGVKRFSEGGNTDEFSGTVATAVLNVGSSGGSSRMDGDIGEIIIYKKGLDDNDRSSVEEYLMDKWGVSGSVPVSDSMTLWLDAADVDSMYLESSCTTNVSASGNTVGCWKDKSGNGLDVIQGTAANEPAYIVNGQNDLSVLRFDGTNDQLTKSSVVGSSVSSAQEVTVFSAYKYNSPVHNAAVLFWQSGTNRIGVFALYGASGFYWDFGDYNGNYRTSYVPTNYTDIFRVISADRRVDDTSTIWVNGANSASATGRDAAFGNSGTATLYAGRSGYGDYLDGDIGELILFKRALTDVERASVEGYLLDKWGVGALPVSDNVKFWLDAADAATVHEATGCNDVAESGDGVACWADKSVSNLDVTQSTAANRPTFFANVQNGKSVVRFDGSNDGLTRASVTGSSFAAAQEATVFVAYEYDAPAHNSALFYWQASNNRLGVFGLYDTDKFYWDMGVPGANNRVTWTSSNYSDVFNIVSMDRRLDDRSTIWVNGFAEATATGRDSAFNSAGSDDIDIGNIDGSAYLKGDVGEIIIYDKEMTRLQRVSVESYLSDKWGVPVRDDDIDLPVRDSMTLWLDGADASTMYLESGCTTQVSATSNTVGCWQDKSGNGMDMTQTTAANEPTYIIDGRNGKSVLRFDGTNDVLTKASVVGSRFGVGHEVTVFAAYEYINKSGGDYNSNLFYWLATGRINIIGIHGNGWIYWDYGANCCGADGRTTYTPSNYMDNFNVLSADRRVDDTSQIWVNGVLLKSEGSKTSVFPEGQTATFEVGHGSSGYTKADIGDLMIYKREMSDLERRSIEDHLMDKWGVYTMEVNDSNLKIWFDAADPDTIHEASACNNTAESGDAVQCWQDKSSSGEDVTQTTASNQPTYFDAPGNGGVPVVRFDDDDKLVGSDDSLLDFGTNDMAWLVAAKTNASADANNSVFGNRDNSGNFDGFASGFNASEQPFAQYRNTTDLMYTGVLARPDEWIVMSTVRIETGELTRFFVNGDMVSSTSSQERNVSGRRISVGVSRTSSSEYFDGDIGEILIYDKALTPTELVSLENYLGAKWDVNMMHNPAESNKILWFDASNKEHLYSDTSCVTNVAVVGDTVGCWADISGNGKHATQSVEAERPTYQPLVQNGRSTVRFDATNDGMITTLGHNAAYTASVVFNYRGTASAARRAIQGGPSGSGPNWLIGPYNDRVAHFASGWVTNTSSVNVTQYQFYVATATNDGADSLFYVDGVDYTNDGAPSGYMNNLSLGYEGRYAEVLDGDIAEVIVYNVVLGNPDRVVLEGYLGDKWGVTVQ